MIVEGVELRLIDGCNHYWISACGRVWSASREISCAITNTTVVVGGRWLKFEKNKFNHSRVNLVIYGQWKKVQVHRLVALAWIGPPPFEGAMVLHKDDNPDNNHVSNLRWGTKLDNEADTYENGKCFHRAVKNKEQVLEIYQAAKTQSVKEVAAKFGVSQEVVSNIKKKRSWWRFLAEVT